MTKNKVAPFYLGHGVLHTEMVYLPTDSHPSK